MTTMTIKDIGFCADFSRKGDWAFDFAFSLAKRLESRLNVFYFPRLEWPSSNASPNGPDELVALDRKVREYYDPKLGDFTEVGFRVCENLVDIELRRCLFRREYQVMILPYLRRQSPFGDVSVEEFAYRFNGPVVLVGPDRADELYLNPPARVVSWQFLLSEKEWAPLPEPVETL